ncbi:hypothetical protein KPH14_005452 [Odynerus spinipes]|uniref:Uncharacterized protein n=1 Tax=Odynerus spinipes TaxID=1348599 RepID=A0AAD9RCH7_9HYME|nr:hypothetical protein KPH14_005452 [Odynerus spinipes]
MSCYPSPSVCASIEMPPCQGFYNCSYCTPLSCPPSCDISCCSSASCCSSPKYPSCVNRCLYPPQRCSLYLRTPDMCFVKEMCKAQIQMDREKPYRYINA